jgi:hypothetical protein
MVSKQKAKLQQVAQTLQCKQSQGAILAISFIENEQELKDHSEALGLVRLYAIDAFVGK